MRNYDEFPHWWARHQLSIFLTIFLCIAAPWFTLTVVNLLFVSWFRKK